MSNNAPLIHGGDEEEVCGGDGPTKTDDRSKGKCSDCGKKSKRVSLFRLRKSKKLVNQRRQVNGTSVNSLVGGGVGRCFLCLKQPLTRDGSSESATSDPNSGRFSFDKLRTLIEKNDYYSKECNPHLDFDSEERK